MAQTVKITPASGLLEFIGNSISNKPYLQHDDNGNLTLTLQSTKKFTVAGNLKVNGKVTMAQQTLTDGASITWDFNSGANAKVTLGGARTLAISNIETGDTGIILVKQDGVGGRTLSLPGGSIIVGGGSYTASSSANATDVLGVYYDGTNYFWTIGYNTVATPLTSVGITGSDFVISNSPLTANGNIALALATVNSNVGSFGSASAVPVITVNAKGLVTAVSTTAISIPTNLDSLTDVTLTSSATGQLLQYNGSQWVNWTPNYLTGITSGQVTTALGYTPVTNARTLTINGVTYDLTANRTWTIDTVSYTSRIQHGVKAGVAINKGQAVYVTSADGTNMIVGLASNTSEATSSKTMGLLDATVALNGIANVVTEGLLAGLDTSLAGSEGDPVWLGTNGNLIFGLANKPYAPNHLVFIGIVTRKQQNNGEIFVKVQNGFELQELHNVDLTTTVPVNGEILGYNGTLWVNKTIAGWLGFTPANDANVVHTTGNETIAGIKTFSGTTQATSTTTGTIVTAGGVGIAKNLYVGGDINVVGNLVIGGTTTTINAQNLTVSDNMIYLNNGIATTITNAVGNGTSVVYTTQETHNYVIGMSVTITGVTPSAYNLSNQTITAVSTNSFTVANAATGTYSSGGTARAKSNANPDLGWAAGYNDGSYAHTGLFRDATDGIFKFFKGYTPEPDASAFIDTSHASFSLADLQAYNITGNTFVKSGGTSSQFLKADGSVDSSTYLTTGTASSTYQPLDADLTAIAALATTGFLKRTGANTWSLDSNTYLTSYTETDTLATVTGRGATTSTAVTFNGGASISNLLINGAAAYAEGSLALGAMGTGEGGQLVLNKATSYTYAAHLDIWQDVFRILYGTNTATAGVGLSLNLATRQLILPGYTTSSSFSGTATGYLAFDAAGNIITVAVPTGAVSSVNAGTGVSVNSTTGAVTVSIGQSVATTATPTFDYVITTNNGNGTNVKIGDDAWIGDINAVNTLGIKGQQDATAGYITFGSELTNKLGRTGTGALTWGGNTIYHAGNLTNLNQLTNGPGYITSYTETSTLAQVTARGATTSTATSFTGGATITGLTIAKSGTDSTITFPAQTNDPGYIKHYESNNTAIMYFNVSDDSNDYFYFGYTGNPSTFQLRSDGVVTAGTWQGSAIADSYISSAATWNAKQAALSGTGLVKSTGGTISYVNGTSSQFIKGDGSLDSSTYLTTGTASSTYLTISTASSTYLPLSGGTLTGSLTINSGGAGNDTTAYGSVRRLIFDNLYSDVARGPNKITLYADAGTWAAGLGVHNSTVAYYSGDAHVWYRSTSQTTFANIMSLDNTGNLTATSFVKSGGTSTQFLKADGSVDSSTYATQSYVTGQITNLVASAPSTLDTLNELATALGNDPNFATTISTSLGNRLRVDINNQNLTSTQKGYGRTNLGVVIGTDVQAWDADLDAIAALSGTSGFLKKTAANTWSLDTNTYLTTLTDTLATVTGRGATTSTAVTFSGGATAVGLTVNNGSYTGSGSFYQSANATTVISGGPAGENITFGPSNRIFINASQTRVQSLLQAAGGLSVGTFNYPGTYGSQLYVSGSTTAASGGGRSIYIDTTISAAANNDMLIGVDILPTFTNGAFTGITNYAARFGGNVIFTEGSKTISVAAPAASGNGSGLTISGGNATTSGQGGSLTLVGGSGAGGPGSGQVIIGNDTSTYNNTIIRGYTTITSTGPNTGTAFAVFAGGQTGLSIYWDNLTPFMQYGLVSGRQARFVNSSSYTFDNSVTATSLIKSGGTSAQFLKADGSVDTNTYLTTLTDTLATVTSRGATTSTTLTLAKAITTGLYGPSTTGNIAIWQYDASNTGYGIVYNEGSPDTLRIDVSGQALTGTPDFLVGADYAQVNGNTVYHAGNLTNLNQLTNGPGYITTNDRAYPRRSDGTNINFYWSGQSGQPTWLWGSNNGTDFYVWNPSNFSVNYASSAGSAGYADEAKWISFPDGPRDLTDRRPNWNNRSVAWDFVGAGNANGVGNYAGVMTFSPWDGTTASTGDSSYQLAFINETGINASGIPGLRLRNGIDNTWNNWHQIWHSGNFTNNSSNWNTAYNKRPTAIAFSGTSTKTLTLTLGDSSTLTASFTDTDTDAQTLSISGSTLSISGGNSVTLPSGGISQGTADSLYVNVSGDEMTGNLYVYPTSANPAQIQLAGANPELYVHATSGTARMFINRQASGNQATLMFTTGMNVTRGSAWDYTGVPMWSMGMTNNNNTDSFKIAYGDIYDPNSVALEITSAQVAYFRNVPYAGGNLLATRTWVQSQGYLTSLPSHTHDDRYYTESEVDALIGNRLYQARSTGIDFNAFNDTGLYRGSTSGWTNRPASGHNGGALLQIDTHPGNYHSQLYFDTGADRLYFRNANGGSWGSWLVMLHSSNIGSYAWTSSNDGAGSGLDADLLDGYNTSTSGTANTIALRDSSGNLYTNYLLGTYANFSAGNSENPSIGQIWTQNTSDNYLRKSTPAHFRSQVIDGYYIKLDTNTTTSGKLTLTHHTTADPLSALEIRGGGTHTGLYINPQPSAQAHVRFGSDGTLKWQIRAPFQDGIDTSLKIYSWNTGNDVFVFDHDGTLTVSNRLIELSSIRYKTNVESLTPALDKVLQLRPVYYTKIGGTGETEIGLIAEEVAEIYPELIKYNEEGQVDGINYTRIAPILIKTIQEQQELIKNLTKRIDDLENR